MDPSVLSIAPMIQWTDRHYRFMMRQITRKTLLYTEMTMDTALIHNYDPPSRLEPFIGHDAIEYPLALQLGGKNPETLAKATSICESFGEYHEINLNSGCPSKTAKSVGFGAELMWEPPDRIREIVYAMNRVATRTEITVKCRIGTTPGRSAEQGSGAGYHWSDLERYVDAVRSAGTRRIVVHARTCVLRGLSPAQNRSVPPLQYDVVYRLAHAFPDMQFVVNGGVLSLDQAERLLTGTCADHCCGTNVETGTDVGASQPLPLHGCMIGREAYNNPWIFVDADKRFFGAHQGSEEEDGHRTPRRRDVLEAYMDYAVRMQDSGAFGTNTPNILKPLHNFFAGCYSSAPASQGSILGLNDTGEQVPLYDINGDVARAIKHENRVIVSHSKLYKQKLDTLVKRQTRVGGAHVCDSSDLTLRDLVLTALDGTIPDWFLDAT